MLTTRRNARRAFTLIELLVVIAIIAILAAILFPVFAQARSKARQATGTSNAKQVSLAILMYVQDYDEILLRAGRDCQPYNASGAINQCGSTTWQNVSAPYIKNAGVFLSPGDSSKTDGFVTPSNGNLSLLYNDMLSHTTGVDANSYSDGNESIEANGIALAGINAPADCVLLAEGHSGWDKIAQWGIDPNSLPPDWTGSRDTQNKWHLEEDISTKCTGSLTGYDYSGGWSDAKNAVGIPFYNGGGIVAYSDGHVKYVRMNDGHGHPTVCSSLPWEKSIDPLQRNADKDGCNDPNNLPGVGGGNWL